MSDKPKNIDMEKWVRSAKADPVKHRSRQVVEILLGAIGLSEKLKNSLYLKGGTLMSLSHESPRSTTDIDLTATLDPIPFADEFVDLLNTSLARTALKLGYVDLVCKVQSVKRRPKPTNFEAAENPALSLKIGSAQRGSREEQNLHNNQSSQVLEVDVTFKEPVETYELLAFDGSEITIYAYGLVDLFAEKLRSLLQQPVRNRNRRQDVFDIALLLDRYGPIDGETREKILQVLLDKAAARNLLIEQNSFENPRIAEMAKQEWETLKPELEIPLPNFEESFFKVKDFYEKLPWDKYA